MLYGAEEVSKSSVAGSYNNGEKRNGSMCPCADRVYIDLFGDYFGETLLEAEGNRGDIFTVETLKELPQKSKAPFHRVNIVMPSSERKVYCGKALKNMCVDAGRKVMVMKRDRHGICRCKNCIK